MKITRKSVSNILKLRYLMLAIDDLKRGIKFRTSLSGIASQYSSSPKLKAEDVETILDMSLREILSEVDVPLTWKEFISANTPAYEEQTFKTWVKKRLNECIAENKEAEEFMKSAVDKEKALLDKVNKGAKLCAYKQMWNYIQTHKVNQDE